MSLEGDKRSQILIYNYLDYREYLRDFYSSQKFKHSGYSFRVFARQAGLSSPNYLKLIIDGQRRVTDKNLSNIIKGLKLNKKEAKYFRFLVIISETNDLLEKQELLDKVFLERKKNLNPTEVIEDEQLKTLSHWSYWVIRELVQIKEINTSEQIIKKMLFKVPSAKIDSALESLLRVGLISRDGDGLLSSTDAKITTSDGIKNTLIRDLHLQMMTLGMKAVESLPVEDRLVSGLTIALNKEQIPLFKDKVRKFRKELNDEFSMEGESLDQVFHLEQVFFPLSKNGDLA